LCVCVCVLQTAVQQCRCQRGGAGDGRVGRRPPATRSEKKTVDESRRQLESSRERCQWPNWSLSGGGWWGASPGASRFSGAGARSMGKGTHGARGVPTRQPRWPPVIHGRGRRRGWPPTTAASRQTRVMPDAVMRLVVKSRVGPLR
jgi:hypothetical protein